MGRMKPHPKYNVISCRVSDDIRACIDHALSGRSMQEYLHSAIEEKLTSERQTRMNELLKESA